MMVLPTPNLPLLTSLARAILATVTVGTLALAVGAMVRRWHHDRFDRRVKSLCIHYAPTPATLLGGNHSAQCLASLRTLPLSSLELLLEPLLPKCVSAPALATVLEELCLELGLIDVWQRRILDQFGPVSMREALSNLDGLLHFFSRLHFLLRARSARNLGLLRHQPSWPILVKALDDPHPDVQQVALRSLAAIREPQSFPALLDRMHKAVTENHSRLSLYSLKVAMAKFPLSQAPQLLPSLRHPRKLKRRKPIAKICRSRDGQRRRNGNTLSDQTPERMRNIPGSKGAGGRSEAGDTEEETGWPLVQIDARVNPECSTYPACAKYIHRKGNSGGKAQPLTSDGATKMSQSFLTLTLCLTALAGGLCAKAQGQDAAAMEEQYKTCAKHYIPADKCTPEIYRQLKDKDSAPLDPSTASALKAAREYQRRLKNPASMQLHTAYVTEKGDLCLEIGGQNTMGGQTVSRIVYTSKGRWLDEGGFLGSMAQENRPAGGVDRWPGYCTKGFHRKLVPGTDVTDKVNQALKEGK